MSKHTIGFCIHTTRVHSSTRPSLQEAADSHSFSEPAPRDLLGARTDRLYTIVFTLLLHLTPTHLQVPGLHNSWPHSRGWEKEKDAALSLLKSTSWVSVPPATTWQTCVLRPTPRGFSWSISLWAGLLGSLKHDNKLEIRLGSPFLELIHLFSNILSQQFSNWAPESLVVLKWTKLLLQTINGEPEQQSPGPTPACHPLP